MRLCVALLLVWGVVPSAMAQAPSGPRTRPVRDVVVTYRMEGQALSLVPGGVQGPVTLSWDAAGQRVRAEAEGRSQVALIDLRGGSGQAFDKVLRVSLPLPIRPHDLQPLSLEGARLTPRGKETVAGLGCTAYAFESAQGPGTVCLTADGVALRGQGSVSGKPGSFTALNVRYGSLSPDLFTVPAGTMALGGAAGALAGAGGAQSGLAGLVQKFGGASGLADLKSLLGRGK